MCCEKRHFTFQPHQPPLSASSSGAASISNSFDSTGIAAAFPASSSASLFARRSVLRFRMTSATDNPPGTLPLTCGCRTNFAGVVCFEQQREERVAVLRLVPDDATLVPDRLR